MAMWANEHRPRSPTSRSPGPNSGCSFQTFDCSCVRNGKANNSKIRPVAALNSPRTLGMGKPQPGFCSPGWPNAFCDAGVSGTMVLEPSTSNGRSPHHPSAEAAAERVTAERRSNFWIFQGQAHTGAAVGGSGHGGLGQQAQVGHGGVETEYLQKEQVDGFHRPAFAFTPSMTSLAAGGCDVRFI